MRTLIYFKLRVPGREVEFLAPAFRLRLAEPDKDGAVKQALHGP
jgi:hypothetical protein